MGESNPLVAIEAIYSNSFLLGATPGADKSMTRWALLVYLLHHGWTMECHEYIRLRQHYEASLRHWGQVLQSPGATPEAQQRAWPPRSSKGLREAGID